MGLKLHRKSPKKVGDAPGTIVYVGDVKDSEITFTLTTYDPNNFSEEKISQEYLSTIIQKPGIKWLDISGIHKTELLAKIGEEFIIHPLILEDIANTAEQAKIENHDELIYVVLKMFYVDSQNEIRMEHINFILKKNLVISFQETPEDVFGPVRNRIKEGRKKLRASGSDYLLYALIDTIVDDYFTVVRKLGEQIDDLRKSITNNAQQSHLQIIDKIYEEVLVIQKSIEPVEKFIPEIEDYDSPLIDDSNSVYFHDLHDHINQIISTIEAVKEKISSMNDHYIAVISNRTNEVMKTLALVATICAPITLIAGIYGMNFQHMPELSSPFAYPTVLAIMVGVGLSLFSYFKKKKWV